VPVAAVRTQRSCALNDTGTQISAPIDSGPNAFADTCYRTDAGPDSSARRRTADACPSSYTSRWEWQCCNTGRDC